MSDMIVTFEQQLGTGSHDLVAFGYPSSRGDRTGPSGAVAEDPTVAAEVYQGRWLARCPFTGCAGAEYVSFDTGVFFCCECRNRDVDHAYVRVTLPTPKERATVEKLLLARRDPATRNFLKTETVANIADGIGG